MGFDCVEQGRNAATKRRSDRPTSERCPTECPGRMAASLHKLPYVDMRYNGINSIFRVCAETWTAERTHKDVYVKVREPDATERLAVGRV